MQLVADQEREDRHARGDFSDDDEEDDENDHRNRPIVVAPRKPKSGKGSLVNNSNNALDWSTMDDLQRALAEFVPNTDVPMLTHRPVCPIDMSSGEPTRNDMETTKTLQNWLKKLQSGKGLSKKSALAYEQVRREKKEKMLFLKSVFKLQRKRLPAYNEREKVVNIVNQARCVVIAAETGAGLKD